MFTGLLGRRDRFHYDPSLKSLLNSGTSHPVVHNEHFLPWADHIARNLKDRHPEHHVARLRRRGVVVDERGFLRYAAGEDKALYDSCVAHARQYARPLAADSILLLSHPLYLHLSCMNELTSEAQRADAALYLENLVSVLGAGLPRDRIQIAVADTAHHYAAATSRLLEAGAADRAFLTRYDDGRLMNPDEMRSLEGKRVYVAGGFNARCLLESIGEAEAVVPHEQLWAINDLILAAPYDCDGRSLLDHRNIPGRSRDILQSHRILLDELLREFSAKPQYALEYAI